MTPLLPSDEVIGTTHSLPATRVFNSFLVYSSTRFPIIVGGRWASKAETIFNLNSYQITITLGRRYFSILHNETIKHRFLITSHRALSKKPFLLNGRPIYKISKPH